MSNDILERLKKELRICEAMGAGASVQLDAEWLKEIIAALEGGPEIERAPYAYMDRGAALYLDGQGGFHVINGGKA